MLDQKQTYIRSMTICHAIMSALQGEELGAAMAGVSSALATLVSAAPKCETLTDALDLWRGNAIAGEQLVRMVYADAREGVLMVAPKEFERLMAERLALGQQRSEPVD